MSELPAGWCTSALSGLADTVRGVTYNKSQAQSTAEEGLLPILRANNINSGKLVVDDLVFVPEDCVSRTQALLAGDIVVAMSSGSRSIVGKSAQVEAPWSGSFGAFCGVLRASQEIDARYLYHFTQSRAYRDRVSELAAGVNINNLKPGHFEEISVPLAPLAEQKRIAQKLDALLAQVDTLKTRIDAIPALLKRFRQSTLAAAFSARLTGNGDIPAEADHWQEVKFSSVIEDLRYGTAQKCDYNGGTTGVLRIPNIGNKGIVLDDMKSSDFSKTEIKKLELMKGDIVLIRSNGSVELVGKSAVVSEKEQGLLFAGYLIRVRLDKAKSIPRFVNYWLKSPAIRQVIEQIARSTSGVNNINSDEIKSLTFTFPALSAQAEIVRRVEQLFAYADQLEAKVAAARKRIDALTQSLLAKAFCGELVPQDPSDEPASVLLERIRAQRAAAPKPKRGRKAATS
ncbi:restriction endonuclease subunit S [Xanthomonas cucurbitae]|uniref:Restriction endonuclease subunit S n=1 Tax=Xanthomonas cucurbitae TaxID=56453 RepID=A0ABY7YFC7_9XANT|nr:restriction endonuclease subunit S [Xanthomonas cucurbitae]WDM68637.1 restriction endonuclease subunit S [Xanthomonas cucurbitae]WDM72511.1 restriction endonuclease subunit S [Xanthomonas cucurbitae]